MKKARLILLLFIIINSFANVEAEGTKTFQPSSGDYGCIQFNDQGRPFALFTNTDSVHRLYFHVKATNEKVYFAFAMDPTSPATSGNFRIKNPSGTIVYASTALPTTGTGYISSYSQAIAGPKISGSPAGGYTPFSLTPATTGDFYIEFSSPTDANYRFADFDLTITSSSGVTQNGRVWSYAWDMNTEAQINPYYGSFYVYTTDGYVSQVNLDGIEPYGFVVLSNKTGTGVTGNVGTDRQSVAGDSEYPLYKIFVNNPDVTVYPSGTTPVITTAPNVVGGIIYA